MGREAASEVDAGLVAALVARVDAIEVDNRDLRQRVERLEAARPRDGADSALRQQLALSVEDRLNQRMDALLGTSSKGGETGASAQQMAGLEKRIAALEAQPKGLSYEGVWEAGRTYRKGECVTHAGSMWIALDTNIVKPGDPTNFQKAWQLCVKRGAEGKPGKDAR